MDILRYSKYTSVDIYEILKKELMELVIKPGQLMSENEMADRFSISRTSIRAAFAKLRSDNLVTIIPQKGTFASLIDIHYVQQIIYLRIQVESAVNIELAASGDKKYLDMLAQNLQKQERALKGENVLHDFNACNEAFHSTCYKAADKLRLWHIIQGMQTDYTRHRMLDYSFLDSLPDRLEEHRSLFENICKRDADNIRRMTEKHLSEPLVRMEGIYQRHRDYFLNHTDEID